MGVGGEGQDDMTDIVGGDEGLEVTAGSEDRQPEAALSLARRVQEPNRTQSDPGLVDEPAGDQLADRRRPHDQGVHASLAPPDPAPPAGGGADATGHQAGRGPRPQVHHSGGSRRGRIQTRTQGDHRHPGNRGAGHDAEAVVQERPLEPGLVMPAAGEDDNGEGVEDHHPGHGLRPEIHL
jgi:hypothetical protein